ncbi:MAG: IS1595 family transposase [Solirubrobacterales bacterium]
MARPSFPRSIVEFQRRFPDDAACRAYLFASRWPGGFRCPRCQGRKVGDEHRRQLWQCKRCGYQVSATAGTIMHKTRTALTLWFWAAYLVATHTPGISAVQLQRQLGISRYETAWLILQKLRRAMVAPERDQLTGEVEVDETLVGGRREGRHVARRRDEKALVGVIVEVRGPGSGRLRLEVLSDASGDTLTPWVKALVVPGAIVHTDGWKAYEGLAGAGYEHRPRLQRRDHPDHQKLLPRAHRAASNLKTWLQGTHRGVSPEHLPVYLDEFVFRHNRRRTPMAAFQTLLGLGAQREPSTYRQITRRASMPLAEQTG